MERFVGGLSFRFEIDQERESFTGGEDAFLALRKICQRVEVETFQGAIGFEICAIVGDEEFSFHEIDVGLDAGEAVREGVEERAGVFVIVVSVCLGKCGANLDLSECRK